MQARESKPKESRTEEQCSVTGREKCQEHFAKTPTHARKSFVSKRARERARAPNAIASDLHMCVCVL